MSGTDGWISRLQSLAVSAEPHSFPKAPLCHELSLNATPLSIDLLAMHFLSCFDVIVVSVYGRFQIKLWRVLAFKLVISGDYSAAVELTFLFFFWPQNWIIWLFFSAEAISNAHHWNAAAMDPLPGRGDQCWLGLGRSMCRGFYQLGLQALQHSTEKKKNWAVESRIWAKNKTHSPNVAQRDHYVLQWNYSLMLQFRCCVQYL